MNGSESELVALAAGGDRAALQRLLMRHHARLAATVQRRVPADLQGVLAAEDVCQEAYVVVFQQVGSLRDRRAGAFRAWLEAIVERKLVDSVRALRARKRGGGRRAAAEDPGAAASSVAELLDLVAVHERTPSRSVARRELVAGVHAALKQLSEDHREVLRLHYLEGLSVEDTAQRMGRSAEAVVMLCSRALRRLARVVGDPDRFLSRDA